jgi:hypothetical protein
MYIKKGSVNGLSVVNVATDGICLFPSPDTQPENGGQ